MHSDRHIALSSGWQFRCDSCGLINGRCSLVNRKSASTSKVRHGEQGVLQSKALQRLGLTKQPNSGQKWQGNSVQLPRTELLGGVRRQFGGTVVSCQGGDSRSAKNARLRSRLSERGTLAAGI